MLLLADAQIDPMNIMLSWEVLDCYAQYTVMFNYSNLVEGAGEQAFCSLLSDYMYGIQMRGTRTSISSMTS